MNVDQAVIQPKARRRLKHLPKASPIDEDGHGRILRLTVDLGNTVLTKRAAGDLYRQASFLFEKNIN